MKKMNYDEVYNTVYVFYGNNSWGSDDINYDWDMIIREIGKENENTLRDVMNDRRKGEED